MCPQSNARRIPEMTIHQAKITYGDGKLGRFFSEDGTWFYEHQLPDSHARTKSMKYSREWLKGIAVGSSVIASVEFTETRAA
jgi:hypothetical protein